MAEYKLNGFSKAMKQTFKIKEYFSKVLVSLGYKDIVIDMRPEFYSKELCLKYNKNANLDIQNDNFYFLNSVDMYFWDKNFGYKLSINCDSSSIYKNPIDIFSDECTDLLLDFLIVVKFLSNPKELQYIGLDEWEATKEITKQLKLYLEENGFNVNRIFSTQLIQVEKNNKSYSIILRKIITQNKYNHALDDEPLEYSEKDIKPFRDFFTTKLENLGLKNYNIHLYPDLGRLSVQINLNQTSSCIDIFSFHDVLFGSPKIEDIFEEILYYYVKDIKQNCDEILSKMQANDFHIYSCNDDSSVIYAYKYDQKFAIIRRSENLFDEMDGHQFEYFCADLLRQNGFENVSVTSGSGDQGIDIIAYKEDIKYGIQCKCYHSEIGNKAVQEVYAGKTFYNCHVGIVLTNRDFTRSAIDLAEKDGIILWNRTKLLQMIDNCKDVVIANNENSIFNI